uniref:M-phase inducer phosphatase n=1 Tax=Leptobrachium leishanense TaxID=445787 RepID=A0A8C5MUR9_9ANUR
MEGSRGPDDAKLDGASFLGNGPGLSDSSMDEALTFSPDLGLSPVTGQMGHLKCSDRLSGVTPRRRLKLSPDSQNPSPTDSTRRHQSAMGTAAQTELPNESTPKPNPQICSTSSEQASETRAWKPKKTRVKLLELFQSPDCITRPQCPCIEKVNPEPDTQQRDGSRGAGDHERSMCSSSPKCNIADSEDEELIGDFTKPYCLPVEEGKHQDLKYISSTTLARLLREGYKDVVQRYWVVDCRYPYEFAGGHIKGAMNFYREEQVVETFLKNPSPLQARTILIFHCEFSSERAPKLCRLLRNLDRNANVYPQLFYPELYILKGGYKDFYERFKGLCEPQGYVNMLHRDFRDHLRQYHRKKKPSAPQRVRKELFKPLSVNAIVNPVKTMKS